MISHAAAATVSVLFTLLAAFVVVIFLIRRRKQKQQIPSSADVMEITMDETEISEANDDGTYLYDNTKAEMEEAPLPSHISLHKDSNLKENSKDMSNQIENLEEEFFNLVEYVKENVIYEKNIATQGNNKEHNRYIDIGDQLSYFLTSSFSSF